MALTITIEDSSPTLRLNRGTGDGDIIVVDCLIQFDASYATGGETLAASDLDSGATSVAQVPFAVSSDGANYLVWDKAGGLLLAHVVATGAEVAATTDLSGADGLFRVAGIRCVGE